ncbi:unnamed protein product [Scytosiphon promiscuus]
MRKWETGASGMCGGEEAVMTPTEPPGAAAGVETAVPSGGGGGVGGGGDGEDDDDVRRSGAAASPEAWLETGKGPPPHQQQQQQAFWKSAASPACSPTAGRGETKRSSSSSSSSSSDGRVERRLRAATSTTPTAGTTPSGAVAAATAVAAVASEFPPTEKIPGGGEGGDGGAGAASAGGCGSKGGGAVFDTGGEVGAGGSPVSARGVEKGYEAEEEPIRLGPAFRVPYAKSDQLLVGTLVCFFRDRIAEIVVVDNEKDLFVSVRGKATAGAGATCQAVAECLELAIRVVREAHVKPSDFLLLRDEEAAFSEDDRCGLGKLSAGIGCDACPTSVAALADQFGVKIIYLPLPTTVPHAGVRVSWSGGGVEDCGTGTRGDQAETRRLATPAYRCGLPSRRAASRPSGGGRAVLIWGIADAVEQVHAHLTASDDRPKEVVVKQAFSEREAWKLAGELRGTDGLSVSVRRKHGGYGGDCFELAVSGSHSAFTDFHLAEAQRRSIERPFAYQLVDMGCIGAMRQFASDEGAEMVARNVRLIDGQIGVRLRMLWRQAKVCVQMLGDLTREKVASRAMDRACEILLEGQKRWVAEHASVSLDGICGTHPLQTHLLHVHPRKRYPCGAEDVRSGIVEILSGLADADLWLDGSNVTCPVPEGVSKDSVQDRLEAAVSNLQQEEEKLMARQSDGLPPGGGCEVDVTSGSSPPRSDSGGGGGSGGNGGNGDLGRSVRSDDRASGRGDDGPSQRAPSHGPRSKLNASAPPFIAAPSMRSKLDAGAPTFIAAPSMRSKLDAGAPPFIAASSMRA